jgi:hypothetical protein
MLANLGQDDNPPTLKSIVRDGALYYIFILSELINSYASYCYAHIINVVVTAVNFFVLLFARVRTGYLIM